MFIRLYAERSTHALREAVVPFNIHVRTDPAFFEEKPRFHIVNRGLRMIHSLFIKKFKSHIIALVNFALPVRTCDLNSVMSEELIEILYLIGVEAGFPSGIQS